MRKIKSGFMLCGGIVATTTYIWSQQHQPKLYHNLQNSFNSKRKFKIVIQAEEEELKNNKIRKPKVLIIGAGLTGCLTSYLLRKKFGDSIDLDVLERSPYPSGRFGAGLRYQKSGNQNNQSWCDMGSQVLSALNCDGGHPNACTSGHGMSALDLVEAWELVKILSQENIISRVPNDGEDERNALDPTGERMIFDNLWAHFWAKNGSKNQTGLSGILTFLLQKASPSNLEFNRLVQWIDWDTKNFLVYSIEHGKDNDSKIDFTEIDKMDKRCNKCIHIEMADIIIVTLPSIHAKNLTSHLLPKFVTKDLENIQYENRAACSFVVQMSPKLALNICEMFGPEKTEINFDLKSPSSFSGKFAENDNNINIHLMIWQDRKTKSYQELNNHIQEKLDARNSDNDKIELSFTFHSTVDSFDTFKTSQEFENYAQNFLYNLVSKEEKAEQNANPKIFEILKSRSVLWPFSQPSAPMEALYAEVKDLEKAYPEGPIYVDDAGLILAGDYFTQSSYIGCFCSAAAATRAVKNIIYKNYSKN